MEVLRDWLSMVKMKLEIGGYSGGGVRVKCLDVGWKGLARRDNIESR